MPGSQKGVKMQVIRFTYANTELRNSVFLMLFFKMNGIYVQERYYGEETALQNRIREFLLGGIEPPKLKPLEYDMELFLVMNGEEETRCNGYESTGKRIMLRQNDYGKQFATAENNNNEVYFKDRKDILPNLISGMLQNGIVSQSTANDLKISADFFKEKKIANLLIATKCFFNPKEQDIYKKRHEEFRIAIQELFAILAREKCFWGNSQYIHLQFAALNIAYEGNVYCRRNQGPVFYSIESMINVCQMLLDDEDIQFRIGNSINLLLANIYDNLTQSDKAFGYYLEACNDYNAFAFYKKALIYMDTGNDYDLAEKYLIKALAIYPEYVRAWYMLGLCYEHQNEFRRAQEACKYLRLILQQRRQACVLSTMETEHLYLSALSCGNMKMERLKDYEGAVKEYEYAEKIWNEIPETKFYEAVDLLEIKDENIEHMREVLSVNVVYSKMSECFIKQNAPERAREILKKLPWQEKR